VMVIFAGDGISQRREVNELAEDGRDLRKRVPPQVGRGRPLDPFCVPIFHGRLTLKIIQQAELERGVVRISETLRRDRPNRSHAI
jgi:hypothetical protein